MMNFDFSNIQPQRTTESLIDPIEIFQSGNVSDPGINDLWLAQGDTLREWHENRTLSDIGIVLNTGAGKTLVGLLIAQSLANETSGHVLYACSSIQLVEQTAEKARSYGLDVTTYYSGRWSDSDFIECKCPCITTYQALFNGKTIFTKNNYNIKAVIFDDAHTAGHLLRDHFSLNIDRDSYPSLYTKITALFKEYHDTTGYSMSYKEMCDRVPKDKSLFLIPPFEVKRNLSMIRQELHLAKLNDDVRTMFSWPYIRDHIDLCCIFISKDTITLTPPIIPVKSLHYFKNDITRIYLSATLRARDAFARTFGRIPDRIIAPLTTAGECERLILFPSIIDRDDISVTKDLISQRKALILVPTKSRNKEWKDLENLVNASNHQNVSNNVRAFKEAEPNSNTKLMLTARYDGVDLPGDTCRIMVIDDLPIGSGPLERFLWNSLNQSKSLRSTLASRIVQSFGRISRGMSDHGVIIITGRKLNEWLLTPKNKNVLPVFLRRQIDLGRTISKQANSLELLTGVIKSCLNRDDDWINTYRRFFDSQSVETDNDSDQLMVDVALAEVEFISALWDQNSPQASSDAVLILKKTLEKAFEVSHSTGAWHCLWLGYAYELCNDHNTAQEMYSRAQAADQNIPKMISRLNNKENCSILPQIENVFQQIRISGDGTINLPKQIHSNLALLNGNGSSAQIEEALRWLGQYLGFESTRPDNDKNIRTGPDVLWIIHDSNEALCMEVKTDKEQNHYQKSEVSQLGSHVQWVSKHKSLVTQVYPAFVGPLMPATQSANPSDQDLVIELSQFKDLADRLVSALEDAVRNVTHLTLKEYLAHTFITNSLLWADIFPSISSNRLQDI